MPYLTPDEIPEDGTCRPLSIPSNAQWLAIVSGALTELTMPYNWEQFGSVTVEEAVDRMQQLVDEYYAGACDNCEVPEGGSVIRLTDEGLIEVLSEGAWITPTEGDYFIPDPAAREGGTEADQICLAAANAVNVYEQLYESLSESFGGDLDEAEALTALIGVMVGVIGFAFAPIVGGIYLFLAPIFAAMYTALEYITADLWDEDFSQTMECFLVNCATNIDGVVTFDWQCFIDQLNAQTNPFILTQDQIRLYLQVIYLLYFTGGVDGLNLAGGTTEIDEADCSECVTCETYDDAMLEGIGSKTRIVQVDPANTTFWIYPTGSPYGEWTDVPLTTVDGYVKATDGSPHSTLLAAVVVDLGLECLIDDWSFDYFKWGGTATCDIYVEWGAYDGAGDYITGGGDCRGGGSFGWYPEYYLSFNTVARYLFFKVYGYTAAVDFGITNIHVQIT